MSPQRDQSPVSPLVEARSNLLSILPRIMACMATLWKAVNVDSLKPSTTTRGLADGLQKIMMGDPKVNKTLIFLVT
jgi:hypothetical protein